ncbi:MAG: TetR/AcrR family transcriptional regulator [Candidatus Eisenbacteria bacterium]|uniref:TetR/AcrR family transcriptional regulator n=1 Tax=Eiseniibacteriota bacterium TaxID=2212470 RepID=A0A948W4Y5_UNCEI|nr:TetR/AcrR family transcriptional regulator [Candidatus Eisenbacteria bacterium]MBU1949669.1 TetR/AcrR family transcriptional regulator [Candidatus Eisenbacteria bacterium]MBU2692737.1 TetR/AcrR family transcriptional regulator [Candidatus Eisenbacteria bacterium]
MIALKKSRQQRRTQVTRKKLMEAARQVFAEKGLDLTNVGDITERADVGKGTFYYHFQTKEKLIRELIRILLAQLSSDLRRECEDITDLGLLLNRLISVHIAFFSNRWEDFVLFYQGRADLTLEQGYAGIETTFIEYLKTIENLIAEVIHQPLSDAALRRIACAVAGFVSGYYSFAVIAAPEDEVGNALVPMQQALVTGLVRFIATATQQEISSGGNG